MLAAGTVAVGVGVLVGVGVAVNVEVEAAAGGTEVKVAVGCWAACVGGAVAGGGDGRVGVAVAAVVAVGVGVGASALPGAPQSHGKAPADSDRNPPATNNPKTAIRRAAFKAFSQSLAAKGGKVKSSGIIANARIERQCLKITQGGGTISNRELLSILCCATICAIS